MNREKFENVLADFNTNVERARKAGAKFDATNDRDHADLIRLIADRLASAVEEPRANGEVNWREFTREDWFCWMGSFEFPDGTQPLITELNGLVIIADNGVDDQEAVVVMVWADGDEEDPQTWQLSVPDSRGWVERNVTKYFNAACLKLNNFERTN